MPSVYRRSKTNIRRAPRRRRAAVRRAPVRRRRVTTRRSHRRVAHTPQAMTPTTQFVLAQIDPFDVKCLGAKVPDSNTMPSIANTDTDQLSLAAPSAAGNNVAIALLPGYAHSYNVATQAAGAVTWTNTFSSRRNYTSIVGAAEAFRPVAHAIRISSGLSPTSATGFVHIGLDVESRWNDTNFILPDFPLDVNAMTGLAFYKKVTLASLTQSPLTAINKWIDESAFRYQDPREVTQLVASGTGVGQPTFQFYNNWATIIIMIEGAPTGAAPLSIEHLLSTELLPKKTAFIMGGAAAPNSAGVMSAASSMAADTEFTHTEAEQESYMARSARSFAEGAAAAGENIFVNVAQPLLQHVGAAAVNSAAQYAYQAATGTGGITGINSNPSRLALN